MDTLEVKNIHLKNEPSRSFSYIFEFGKSYLLDVGLVNYYSWKLSWAIGGEIEIESGDIFRNGVPSTQQNQKAISWHIRCDEIRRFGIFKQSLRRQIQSGIKQGKNRFLKTEQEFIDQFYLSPPRYNRFLQHISSEIWRASCAVGLAHGKEIFCFPYWHPDRIHEYYNLWFGATIEILKSAGCLVLLPTNYKNSLLNCFDVVVHLPEVVKQDA